MAIEVFDFYTKDKINVDKKHNLLLSNALFYVLLNLNGQDKELSIQVPKKFHYERIYKYNDFAMLKVTEFSILVDFVRSNKELVSSKWCLTEADYQRLITGLERALIKNYFIKGELFKWPLLLGVWIEEVIDWLVRRFS